MEREAVLHWLEDVQIEESDGGLFNPNNISHHNSTSPTPNIQSCTEVTKANPQLSQSNTAQLPYSLVPSSTFQVPQDPSSLIVNKRYAFTANKSNTLSSEPFQPKSGKKLQMRSPSFDMNKDSFRQSSPSPLPALNPDIILPTVSFTKGEQVNPRRKPLLKQPTIFSDVKTQTPSQSQLLWTHSVGIPQRGKSAPASPESPKSRKYNSLSVVGRTTKSYSQGDIRQYTQTTDCSEDSDASEESGISCAAERALSDIASSNDFEMPRELDSEVSGKEICMANESNGRGRSGHNKIEERVVVAKTGNLESESSEFDGNFSPFQVGVRRGQSPSLPILPSEINCLHDFQSAEAIPSFLAKRNPMQRSSSVQHHQSPVDSLSSRDASLGIESLAFHDHHLSRRGHHVVTKVSMVGSSKLQQISAVKPFAHADSASYLAKEKLKLQRSSDL